MKIYTKKGDRGETSLWGGKRVPKYHLRIEAYGTVDELNSFIGLVRDHLSDIHIRDILKQVQDRLFTIGATLAADPNKSNLKTPDLKEEDVILLEKEIDQMNESLPPLRAFILPGGHTIVSLCHIARCVCRRAERRVVHLAKTDKVPDILIQYLNRLSDYLFVLARQIGKDLNVDEITWEPRK